MFETYLGISSDYIILGLAALIVILFILIIINIAQMAKMKKRYKLFMMGNNAKSLEDTLISRFDQVDEIVEAIATNERNIDRLFNRMTTTFQKYGLVKYDAFNEMGGKLSFCLAMLNEQNDGFILNVVHSREGCYNYVKEIIAGNSIIALAEEEEEALNKAMN